MNQQVALRPASARDVTPLGWTSKQLQTIRENLARDCTPPEFDMFIEYARNKGLDPFSRQIIVIVFSKDNPDKRKVQIIVTQDGQRVLAARCGDYRPAEDEPVYTYSAEIKRPTNPLGIEKCSVTLFKQDNHGVWNRVNGVAYWDEFAPVKEIWAYDQTTNKRKPTGKFEIEGNWKKMPRLMLAKCATMLALRAGWPETFSGVYSEEEMASPKMIDVTASEAVEHERQERRQLAVGMMKDEFPFIGIDGVMTYVPAGQYGDFCLREANNLVNAADLESMRIRNREALARFWANHKADALDLKEELDKLAGKLKQRQAAIVDG